MATDAKDNLIAALRTKIATHDVAVADYKRQLAARDRERETEVSRLTNQITGLQAQVAALQAALDRAAEQE